MNKKSTTIFTVALFLLAGCSDGPGKKDVVNVYGNNLDKIQGIERIADRNIEFKLLGVEDVDCKKDGEIFYICSATAKIEVTGSRNTNNNKTVEEKFKLKLKNHEGKWVNSNSDWN
ncbi:hypothetical protein [Comamonas sp. JUb58]|uniref:hypothetical protein n=1 Tax=Comamonas sp. JUb58 TaxID=2485114 RepID=UPI00105F96B1|nr:hypothetical protein [Comamonas sp. JUb58]TDS70823.1 hypothetical protein EDF71_12753 [Comamonas sp. JUb58]